MRTRKQFYEKALPTKGTYCITDIYNGSVKNYFTESLADVENIVWELDDGGSNVFVAPLSFDSHSRKAEHAAYARSFFLDLDVGDSPKKYPSKDAALAALHAFVELSGLPPPVEVDSGTGIHVYWLFEDDVPAAEWLPYARKFKEICQEHLLIDPVVTADRARIMRAINTSNHKVNPPVLTVILNDIYQYDFETFKKFLGPLPHTNEASEAILASVPKGLDTDTAAFKSAENFETVFENLAVDSLSGNGCNQIKYALENSVTLPEPLWHSVLSIAQHCLDRDEAIHKVSEDYPGYNWEETIRKANATQDKPHSCEIFEERNPGGCNGCPYRGKITNPLALGRQVKAATADSIRLVAHTQDLSALPKDLKGFSRSSTGAIIYTGNAETDSNGNAKPVVPTVISAHNIYPIKRMFSNVDGECLLMKYILPHDPTREFLIPVKSTAEEILKIAGTNGLSFPVPAHGKLFVQYILRWGQYLLDKNAAELMRMQMGWTEDNDAFVIGYREFKRDGTEVTTAASPFVRSIAKLLKPVGSYDKWKEAANKLNQPSLELTAFAMLCGFGSPLMRLTSTRGVTVNYVGGAGHGKTGSLYSALSIFGSPVDLMLANGKGGATLNAANQWMLGLKNLMLGMDEVSNMDPKDLSNTIHQISQGKGKLRMQASVNAVRELELTCAQINFSTSNQPMTDKMFSIKKDPAGEMARLLEFIYDKPQIMIDKPWLGSEIYDVFRTNYGHAGPEYIKEVLRMGDAQVQMLVNKWIGRFAITFGKDTTYRFYENLIGVAFAGGEIAKNVGIINFDLDKIYSNITMSMLGSKDKNKINDMDYEALLGEFQNKYTHGTLILENDRVVREPRTELVARMEIHSQRYYCSKSILKKFLVDNGNGVREFETRMKEKNILVGEIKQRLSNGWGGGNSTSPIHVYIFRYDAPPGLITPGT